MSKQNKRKHHFLPKCYLKNFADLDKKIWAYRLEDPACPFQRKYENFGHIRDYYSQLKPDGTTDYNLLEDFFDDNVESYWPTLITQIEYKETLSPDQVMSLLKFMIAQRLRVPATRDLIELCLAHHVKSVAEHLDSVGSLPQAPDGLQKDGKMDWDKIIVTIDPRQSLHRLVDLASSMSPILDNIGYTIILNNTNIPFITSDNPVCYYTPKNNKTFRPYTLTSLNHPIELVFPLTDKMCLLGLSSLKETFGHDGLSYTEARNKISILDINDTISRFAYQFAYSKSLDNGEIIRRHSNVAPVPNFSSVRTGSKVYNAPQIVFGERPKKPKWQGP